MENEPFEDVFPIGKGDFHCHVSLLEGMFYFHPETWGKIPILTNIFQMGWFNHQPENPWYLQHQPVMIEPAEAATWERAGSAVSGSHEPGEKRQTKIPPFT